MFADLSDLPVLHEHIDDGDEIQFVPATAEQIELFKSNAVTTFKAPDPKKPVFVDFYSFGKLLNVDRRSSPKRYTVSLSKKEIRKGPDGITMEVKTIVKQVKMYIHV